MDLSENLAELNLYGESNSEQIRKREEIMDWEEYFMATAILASKRSKDPNFQVGACVVNQEKRIVGVGYNGMPIGCNDDDFPWGKKKGSMNDKSYYVCHAEMNAIVTRPAIDVRGCSIYVGLFPCNECAKVIIQSGITEVVYLSDCKAHKIQYQASKRMFESAKVQLRQYKPKNKKVEIVFDVDWDNVCSTDPRESNN